MRRTLIAAAVLLLLLVALQFQPPAAAAAAPPWPQIGFETVATGLNDPVQIAHAGDGSGRLFVIEQGGRIRIIEGGILRPQPFLDISGRISCCGERGLLGLAFAPDYPTSGTFYLNYTNPAGNSHVSRFQVSADPQVADPNSEQVVLQVGQDYSNHNGGAIAFGPDGMLYVGMGDGGSAGDPQERAQDPNQLLGKILRLDVTTGTPPTYTIPPTNPFVQTPGYRGEIWALGVRNPWRISFDRLTGALYIADVGQNQWEEVNVQPGGSAGGQNYGWDCYEGTHSYEPTDCGGAGDYTFPEVEYSHSLGCSVSGGYAYRGTQYAALSGVYLYADYCSGRIWGLREAGGGWESSLLDSGTLGFGIVGFGEDQSGEIYIADQGSGTIYHVTANAGQARSAWIFLRARAYGPLRLVTAAVLVRDQSGAALPGVTVQATWRQPSGAQIPVTGVSGPTGLTPLLTVGPPGTYTLTVNNIVAPGYPFDAGGSVLSRTINVP